MDPSAFYGDPQNMFNLMGSAGPLRDFPTISEARNQTRALSKSIFYSRDKLHAILDKREEVLRKRWMKKTKDQRTKILLAVWPDMPASHRPDFQALLRADTHQDRSALPKRPFKWPYVNLEDLTHGKSLLLLLNSRGRHLPEAFAHADLEALHVGITSRVVDRNFLNGYTAHLAHQRTVDDYGRLVSWEDDDDAFEYMHNQMQFSVGDGLLVLEVQERLYMFLLDCCHQIFQDVTRNAIADDAVPSIQEPPPIIANETSYAQISTLASEALYPVPHNLDIERLKLLIAARRAATIDHLFDLREDPAYFTATVTEWADHRQERIRDVGGRRHPHDDDLIFWDRVLTAVVADAIGNLLCFDMLIQKVLTVQDLEWVLDEELDLREPLPEKLEDALLDMRFALESFSQGPIFNLRMGAPASPTLRPLFDRMPQELGTSKMAVKSKRGPAGDPLMTLLTRLFDQDQVFLLRLTNIVDELQRVIEKDQTQKARVSSWVAEVFSDLALFGQLMHQIDIFYPWSAGFQDKLDLSKDERITKHNNDMRAANDLHLVMQKCPSLARLGSPNLHRFHYPAERRRNAANTKAMQEAEHNLDAFWKRFDDHYQKETGIPLQEMLQADGVEVRDIRRTPDWSPRVRAPTAVSTETIRQSVEGTTVTSAPEIPPGRRQMPEVEKVKFKTRGVADSTKAAAAPAPIEPTSSSVKHTTLLVSKRAYKVFSSLFNTPGDQDQAPGEVPWSDFPHAMTVTGFEVEKRHGSAWQFSPKNLDVDTPIQFHEPHPSGKISWDLARRIGRRLARNYGLTINSFVML